jgi:zinc transport system substrate-binding protein
MKLFLNFFLLSWILANSGFAQEVNSKKPTIIASINPIYQILLAITEDKNNSILIINPSLSEHNYQLKKSDVKFFSKADLIFYIDGNLETGFSKLIKNFAAEKKSYKLSQVADIKLLQRRDNPKKLDLHIWLNPQNAIKIAEFMTQKICEIDQENSKKYQQNLEKFKNEIVETEKLIHSQLASIKDRGFVFYHDGYQYFEDYFSIKPLQIMAYDRNRDLSVKDMREFSGLVKSGKVKCIFGEPQDEKNSAMKLATNYKIKFAILDLLGLKENFGKKSSSYKALLLNISDDLVSCLNPESKSVPDFNIL